jgi:hypothetical protein
VTNCLSLVTGRQADSLLTEVLSNPQVQKLRQRLASQGLAPNFAAAKVYSGPQCALVSIPIGPDAALYYVRTAQGTSVTAVTSQGRRRIYMRLDGSIRSVLSLNKDQVRDIWQQISETLQKHGITKGYVRASIDELRQEVWLTVKDGPDMYIAVLGASSWSEAGSVIIESLKKGPVLLSCSSRVATSAKPALKFRLAPQAKAVFCAGDGDCPGGSDDWIFGPNCINGQKCYTICSPNIGCTDVCYGPC